MKGKVFVLALLIIASTLAAIYIACAVDSAAYWRDTGTSYSPTYMLKDNGLCLIEPMGEIDTPGMPG